MLSQEIAQIPLLHNLSVKTLQRIADVATVSTAKAGTIFFEQGVEPPAGLYFVKTGYAILYRQSKEKAQILAIVSPQQYFGGESLPNHAPCPYTAKAIASTTHIYLAPEAIQGLLTDCPDFLGIYLEIIALRVRQLTALVHTLAFHDVTSRVAAVLLTLGETESEQTSHGLRIPRVLSQKDLAAMVGTSREVVYRVLKQFETDSLLTQTSTDYYVLDLPAFIEIATTEVR